MKLHELKAFQNEQKNRKRRGRGGASGVGTTAGRGHKGQKARAGGGPKPEFEGGQLPLIRRLPKRGFKNPFPKKYNLFNLDFINEKFSADQEVNLEEMYKFCSQKYPIKILAKGEIDKPLKIQTHKISAQAESKIKQAGGKVHVMED